MNSLIIFFIFGLIFTGHCNVIKREAVIPSVQLSADELLLQNELKDNTILPNEPNDNIKLNNNEDITTISAINIEPEQSTDLIQPLQEQPLVPAVIELENIQEQNGDNKIELIELQNNDNLRLDTTDTNEILTEKYPIISGGSDGLRQQNGGSTQRPNIIQQLVQNNPLTNFIQNIRPRPTTQPQSDAEVGAAAAAASTTTTTTTQANFIQQGFQQLQQNFQTIQHNLQQQVQGLQQNIQGFINPIGGQSTNSTARPPPFNLFNNLFTPLNGTNQSSGGGNNGGPIQNILGGIFGGNNNNNNNNRDSSTTTVSTTTVLSSNNNNNQQLPLSSTIANLSPVIIDEVNDPSENEHDIYVGEDENLSQGY